MLIYSHPTIKRFFFIGLLVASLLFYNTTYFRLLTGGPPKGPYAAYTYFNILIFSSIVALALLKLHYSIRLLFRHGLPLLLFLCYVAFSHLWSSSPELGTSILFIAPILFIIGLYYHLGDIEGLHKSLRIFFFFIVLGNIIFSIFIPDFGRHADGVWRGVFGDRNYACFFTCLALAYYLFSFLCQKRHKIFLLGMVALCLVFVFFSGSATGRITALLILLQSIFLPIISKNKRTFVPIMIFVIMIFTSALFITALNYTSVLELLGKDATLTGRTNIWEDAIGAIEEKPLFGYGPERLFISRSSGKVTFSTECPPNQLCTALATHNTYLTFILSFGIVGAALMGLVYLKMLFLLIQSLYKRESHWTFINLSFFISMLIFQLTLDFYANFGFTSILAYLYVATITEKAKHLQVNPNVY